MLACFQCFWYEIQTIWKFTFIENSLLQFITLAIFERTVLTPLFLKVFIKAMGFFLFLRNITLSFLTKEIKFVHCLFYFLWLDFLWAINLCTRKSINFTHFSYCIWSRLACMFWIYWIDHKKSIVQWTLFIIQTFNRSIRTFLSVLVIC